MSKGGHSPEAPAEQEARGQEAAFSTSSLEGSEVAVALPELGNAGPQGLLQVALASGLHVPARVAHPLTEPCGSIGKGLGGGQEGGTERKAAGQLSDKPHRRGWGHVCPYTFRLKAEQKPGP